MKIAVATICYNEAEYIGACIDNWKGLVDKHLVLVTNKPWNGSPVGDDGCDGIARKRGAEVIIGEWKTEAEQRNFGLARLYDYDYVLIIDADEFYTKEDQQKILSALNNPIDKSYSETKRIPAFTCTKMVTYWKNSDYIFDPPDKHKPYIAVDPKQVRCYEHRQFKYLNGVGLYLDYVKPIDVSCHHMSWAKSDDKVKEKLESFSHADIIKPGWYYEVWLKWKPNDTESIRPYGSEESKAIYKPAPEEIKMLIKAQ